MNNAKENFEVRDGLKKVHDWVAKNWENSRRVRNSNTKNK